MKKYLLFDLDGTLTDPKIGITTCVQYALKSYGIEEPDLDKLEPFIGPPLKDSFMQFYGMDEKQAEAAIEKYRERFRDTGIFENKIYKGVPAMLRTLKAKGMSLAVASSKPTVFVKRILEHFHIEQYFDVVVGSELDGRLGTKTEVVQEALRQLFPDGQIRRDEVYMIGDRKFDVEGARNVRVESIGVAYGYGSMEELKEAKADYIVRSVPELEQFLLRGTEKNKADITPSQRIWALVFPLLVFLIVRMLVVNALALTVQSFAPGEPVSGDMVTIITAISYLAGAAAVWVRARHLIRRAADDMWLSHLKGEPVSAYLYLAMVTVGAVLGLNLLFDLTGFTESSASFQSVAAGQYAGSVLLGLLCYGVISPIAEELLFRGIVYNYLKRFAAVKRAILFSALLFGLYHMNAVQAVYGFVIGCIMAYGYEYFGTFKIPVAIHIVANVTAYLLTCFAVSLPDAAAWAGCAVCLILAAAGAWKLHGRKNIL